jgi:cbb3-type cytochrome oxidase subunit 3
MLKKIKTAQSALQTFSIFVYLTVASKVFAQPEPSIQVDEGKIGFKIPNLADILTFLIRGFFILAGIMALLMLLLGALAWVTSGGNKENVDKARDKITAAILGLIIIVAVLAIIVTMEQIVFGQRLCLGLSCGITIPSLLQEAP